MGRFHHSSDSDYEPSEVQRKKKSKNKRIEVQDPNKKQQLARKKSKMIEEVPKKKTMAEKYPLLSNYLRLHFPEESVLEKYLSMIGEEDAATFEDSWDQIYHCELYLIEKMERLRDRFRHLIIKHLNLKD